MIPKRYENASWEGVPEAIKSRVDAIRETRRGLYIHGGVGSGKTHAAYAILKHFKDDLKLSATLHITTELMFDIKRDFDRSVYDKARWDERLPSFKGVLILDDIGAERLTDFVAETFYLIVNTRYNQMLPTIFTSNFTIGELAERVGDRIASRIVEMCDVVEIIGEDRRMASPQKVEVRL